jgi:hypothetical protein
MATGAAGERAWSAAAVFGLPRVPLRPMDWRGATVMGCGGGGDGVGSGGGDSYEVLGMALPCVSNPVAQLTFSSRGRR